MRWAIVIGAALSALGCGAVEHRPSPLFEQHLRHHRRVGVLPAVTPDGRPAPFAEAFAEALADALGGDGLGWRGRAQVEGVGHVRMVKVLDAAIPFTAAQAARHQVQLAAAERNLSGHLQPVLDARIVFTRPNSTHVRIDLEMWGELRLLNARGGLTASRPWRIHSHAETRDSGWSKDRVPMVVSTVTGGDVDWATLRGVFKGPLREVSADLRPYSLLPVFDERTHASMPLELPESVRADLPQFMEVWDAAQSHLDASVGFWMAIGVQGYAAAATAPKGPGFDYGETPARRTGVPLPAVRLR
jgi:hypothetical protein